MQHLPHSGPSVFFTFLFMQSNVTCLAKPIHVQRLAIIFMVFLYLFCSPAFFAGLLNKVAAILICVGICAGVAAGFFFRRQFPVFWSPFAHVGRMARPAITLIIPVSKTAAF